MAEASKSDVASPPPRPTAEPTEASATSDAAAAAATDDEPPTTRTAVRPSFLTRKPLPPVQYLLAHGDPETAHLPKTWCEIIGYPVALGLVFAISLLIFHHAPHHLAPAREQYSIPGVPKLFEKRDDAYLERNKLVLEKLHKKRLEEEQRQTAEL